MRYGFLSSVCLIAGAFMAATITIDGIVSFPAQAENSDISVRRATERTTFTDDEIKDGFFKTAFRGELQLGRHDERIRKFDEPVRVFVVNQGDPDRNAVIAAIVRDIRARVNHLELAITTDAKKANLVVMLVPARDFARTIRSRYGEDAAKEFNIRFIRNVCRESPRIRAIAFGGPRSSCRSTLENFNFTTAPTKNCCNRWG
jgi:hypothetical protein